MILRNLILNASLISAFILGLFLPIVWIGLLVLLYFTNLKQIKDHNDHMLNKENDE